MNTNADNRVFEILIMDTADITTATKVWRWNSGGLGYSSTGYAGTYTTAITQDGAIVADFITTGTLNAAEINVINLIAEQVHAQDESNNTLDINTGMLKLFDGTNFRAAVANAYSGTTGSVVSLKGNTAYPTGALITALLDDNARLSVMNGDALYVGLDKYDVPKGYIYASDAHIPYLYVTKIIIGGGSAYTVAWKQVNLSAGGTAWALCQA